MIVCIVIMVQGVRSLQSDGKSFDFNSERGVRDLLKAIRESDVPAQVRNELRDLVFMYASGGGDNAVRNILEEQIRSYNIAPLANAGSEILSGGGLSTGSGFSHGRPAPVFRSVTIGEVKTLPVIPALVPETPVSTVVVVPTAVASVVSPIAPELQVDLSQSQSANPLITPTLPVVKEKVEATVPPSLPLPMPIVPVFVTPPSTPATVPETAPILPKARVETMPTVAPVQNAAAYIERIREIKTEVNNRIGNPVNLISIDKVVGNEYMQALLSAMKQLNGGDSSAVALAMNKLEKAYSQVMVVINNAATRSAAPAAIPQAKVITPTLAGVSSGALVVTPQSPIVLPPPAAIIPSIPLPVASIIPSETVLPDSETVLDSVPHSVPLITTEMAPPPRPRIEIKPPVTPEIAATIPVATDGSQAVPITSTRFNMNASVAAATPLRSIDELPTAATLQDSFGGDVLLTKEVDDGLQQLLAEWGLFKKSGLFGTGPNGREHPLFKKVAPLQIPLLLSGRFEGSTQEIKQSITDYMNGWRYEQGIVYQEGETFETYLRRVIKHIIDWQSKKLGT